MKNKLLLFILAIAMFIPTVVAITNYTSVQSAPIDEKTASKLVIADLDGAVYTFEKKESGDDASEMIDFFLRMNANATKLPALPDQLMGMPFFKITLSDGIKSSDYQYYFSANPKDCYFVAADGTSYSITEADASAFIVTDYAASLYEEAVVPAMILSGQYKVNPAAVTWMYKNYSGQYIAALTDNIVDVTNHEYDLEGGFEVAYETEPDYLALKIYDKTDNSLLYDDLYENIASLSITGNMTIRVEMEAKWYEDESRSYYGTMNYAFDALVSAPAEFYLGETTIKPGEFTVLTGINVSNIDKIQFASEPAINYTPTFFRDGEFVHALIPIHFELDPVSSYTFTISYGGVTQTIKLNMAERTFRNIDYNVSASVLNATRTEATLAAFDAEMAPYARTASDERYWNGTFLEATKGTLTQGFGLYRKISATGLVYRHLGVDYQASQGSDVTALNAGKVIYVGYLDLSGYTVVIEHGYGLKSWYCNLDGYNVAVDDIVERGAVIGAAGNTGFTNQNGVHVGLSVFDVPVCQYPLWEEGIIMYTPNK